MVSGAKRDELSAAALAAVQSGTKFEQEYSVYPHKDIAPEAYLDRRRKVAYAMYELQGVGRKDNMAKMQAMARNWEFFDAPVAIIVTVDRVRRDIPFACTAAPLHCYTAPLLHCTAATLHRTPCCLLRTTAPCCNGI